MGRKNSKGRRAGENPRRFYRPKRSKSRYSGSDRGEDSLASQFAPRPEEPWPPLGPRTLLDLDDTAHIDVLPRPRPRICGSCHEWVPKQSLLTADDRGECLHPGSGFAYPPADMEACPFFR